MIAVRRTELGLSQSDLASRMRMSPSVVARIEAGQTPSAEALKRLGAVLDGQPAADGVRQSVARPAAIGAGPASVDAAPEAVDAAPAPIAPGPAPIDAARGAIRALPSMPPLRFDPRGLRNGILTAAAVTLAALVGALFSGGGGDEPAPRSLQAVTGIPAVVATAEQARNDALTAAQEAQAAQEARAARIAEKKEAAAARKREEAAARQREEAAASAPTSSDEESSDFVPEPVTAPIVPAPAPSSSGGGGGGGGGGDDGGPNPDVSHGVIGGG